MKYLTTVKQEIIFLKNTIFSKNKFIGNEDNEIYKSVIQFEKSNPYDKLSSFLKSFDEKLNI